MDRTDNDRFARVTKPSPFQSAQKALGQISRADLKQCRLVRVHDFAEHRRKAFHAIAKLQLFRRARMARRHAEGAFQMARFRGERRARMQATSIAVGLVEDGVKQHERGVFLVVAESAHDLRPEAFDVSCGGSALADLAQSEHATLGDLAPGLFESRVVQTHHAAVAADHRNDGPREIRFFQIVAALNKQAVIVLHSCLPS